MLRVGVVDEGREEESFSHGRSATFYRFSEVQGIGGAVMIELIKALNAAQKAAKAVSKTGFNKFDNYKYAKAEDMIEEARGPLADNGIVVLPCNKTITTNGDLTIEYLVMHVSGERLVCTSTTPMVVIGKKGLDKSKATAETYDLGYFLRGLLLLPRVEEGTDVDQRNEQNHEPRSVAKDRYVEPSDDALEGELVESLVDSFAKKIVSANDVKVLRAVAGDIRKANLPEDAREKLNKIYGDKRMEMLPVVGAAE